MENVISQDNPPVLYLEFYTTKYTIYFPPYESSSQDASSSTSSSSLPKNKQETEHNPELDEKLELIVKKGLFLFYLSMCCFRFLFQFLLLFFVLLLVSSFLSAICSF